MTIENYQHKEDGNAKTLYRIKYDATSIKGIKPDGDEVYVLASGLENAIDIFTAFYKTREPNPRDFPTPDELEETDRWLARNVLKSIEKLEGAILFEEEQKKSAPAKLTSH